MLVHGKHRCDDADAVDSVYSTSLLYASGSMKQSVGSRRNGVGGSDLKSFCTMSENYLLESRQAG